MGTDIAITGRRPKLSVKEPPKEPKRGMIILGVCVCEPSGIIQFDLKAVSALAKILHISDEQLRMHAVIAKSKRIPQVVACFPVDVAETILAKLNAEGRFIYRYCHGFRLHEE
jgi:hypothetical protein